MNPKKDDYVDVEFRIWKAKGGPIYSDEVNDFRQRLTKWLGSSGYDFGTRRLKHE